MAIFNFNITEGSTFSVTLDSKIVTECSTIFVYKIDADNSDSITMDVGQTYNQFDNLVYIEQSVETSWDGTSLNRTFGSDLYIKYSISNSGVPGYFNKVIINVTNDTQALSHTEETTREDDSPVCGSVVNMTYDELTDTPSSKTGASLKLVRVKADETGHEYVDPGTLGNDLNYTHVFTSTTSVVIPHNLGKIPSVTVIDGSGNIIYGNITYTDLNNLTITFNTAFAGTAYLN